MSRKGITAKALEIWLPPAVDDICGNYKLVQHWKACMAKHPLEEDVHTIVIGPPGTGKTHCTISYLRQRLQDDTLGHEDRAGLWTVLGGKRYGFVRIDGSIKDEQRIDRQVADATFLDNAEHTFVLVDEIGELFFNRRESVLRPLHDSPGVTVYATAQDFKYKPMPGQTKEDYDNRLRAFLRRFTVRMTTENPEPDDLKVWLRRRMAPEAWNIVESDAKAMPLLVAKSGCVVGYAIRCLAACIAQNGAKLTEDFVMEYDADPLTM